MTADRSSDIMGLVSTAAQLVVKCNSRSLLHARHSHEHNLCLRRHRVLLERCCQTDSPWFWQVGIQQDKGIGRRTTLRLGKRLQHFVETCRHGERHVPLPQHVGQDTTTCRMTFYDEYPYPGSGNCQRLIRGLCSCLSLQMESAVKPTPCPIAVLSTHTCPPSC